MMPLIMRRSSSRSGPGRLLGRYGAIRAHCLSRRHVQAGTQPNPPSTSTNLSEGNSSKTPSMTRLVANALCAIDDTWSGLRCVLRRALRPAPGAAMTSARPDAP